MRRRRPRRGFDEAWKYAVRAFFRECLQLHLLLREKIALIRQLRERGYTAEQVIHQSVERLRELSELALDAETLDEFTQALESALAES